MASADTDGPRDCQTQVSQKEKNKLHVISLTWESRKMMQINLLAKQK